MQRVCVSMQISAGEVQLIRPTEASPEKRFLTVHLCRNLAERTVRTHRDHRARLQRKQSPDNRRGSDARQRPLVLSTG